MGKRNVAENLVSVTKTIEGLVVTYEGGVVRTPEDLIEQAGVDMELWELVDSSVKMKQWPTTFKLPSQDGEPDRAVQVQNHMVEFRLKPREDFLHSIDVAERMAEIMEAHSPKYRPVHRPTGSEEGQVLAMLDLYDLHVGMLAWGAETQSDSWDTDILKEEVMTAVETLLQRGAGMDIARFLLVVGNDLLHTDTPQNTTTAGTRQDVDTRPLKMYEMAYLLMVWVIDRLREIADVEVLVVPGNHDRDNAGKIGITLRAHYRQDKHVLVDAGPSLRKHYVWGDNFLGFTHGSEEKLQDLPMIFMADHPVKWGNAIHREIFTGHLHRRFKKKIPAYDRGLVLADTQGTFNGVTVHVIPSLVPPEAWHASKGYVGGGREADIRFFHKTEGPIGHFSHRVWKGKNG